MDTRRSIATAGRPQRPASDTLSIANVNVELQEQS